MVLLTLENVLLHLSYICFLQDDDELCTSMTFFLGDQTYALSHKFKHILSSSYMHDIYKLTFDYVYAIRYINILFTLYWEFCCQVGCSKFRNAATGAGVLGQFFFFFHSIKYSSVPSFFHFFSLEPLLYLTTLFIFLCFYFDRWTLPFFFLYKHYFLTRLRFANSIYLPLCYCMSE